MAVGVDSAPGRGSVFWLTAELGTRAGAASQPAAPLPAGARLLVVDDHAAARRTLATQLERLGFEVAAVDSGEAALAALSAADLAGRPFRAVLLDAKMPGLDGVETARRIGELGLGAPPAMALLCAGMHDEQLRRADQVAGMRALLTKPVVPSRLRAAVMALFGAAAGAPSAAVGAAATAVRARPFTGQRVLLVEDNPVNQLVAIDLLVDAGLSVDLAENGRVALERAQAGEYALVLMDMQMPEMDGIEATGRLRAMPRYARVPILAMTANVLAEDRTRCVEAGMNDFVAKPIVPDELLATLQRWLHTEIARGGPVAEPDVARAQFEPRDLEGVDVAQGVKQAGGKRARYEKLLARFVEDQGDAVQHIRKALLDDRRRDAERMAHTLKGLARQIAAGELANAAETLERAIHDGHALSSLEGPLSESGAMLTALCQSIRASRPPVGSSP
jgi:CheY-like chemotaxis protein/HPt (histidine-containing phosphotransfer) domain-containing protein